MRTCGGWCIAAWALWFCGCGLCLRCPSATDGHDGEGCIPRSFLILPACPSAPQLSLHSIVMASPSLLPLVLVAVVLLTVHPLVTGVDQQRHTDQEHSGSALVLFDRFAVDEASSIINGYAANTTLAAFRDLPLHVNAAGNALTPTAKPIVRRLLRVYEETRAAMDPGFISTVTLGYRFVIKTAACMRRGVMTVADLATLRELLPATGYVDILTAFVDTTADGLTKVQEELLDARDSGRVQDLLREKTRLERELIQQDGALTQARLQLATLESAWKRAEFDEKYYITALQDYAQAKREANDRVRQQEHIVSQRTGDLLRYRDQHHEEYSSFWIFSFKVRDRHVDNGERVAREALHLEQAQLNHLRAKQEALSPDELRDRAASATANKAGYSRKTEAANLTVQSLQEMYDRLEQQFEAVHDELEVIYVAAGSRSTAAFAAVDSVANATTSAYMSLREAHGIIRQSVESIDTTLDSDLVLASVRAYMTIIGLSDSLFPSASQVTAIKQVNALAPHLPVRRTTTRTTAIARSHKDAL